MTQRPTLTISRQSSGAAPNATRLASGKTLYTPSTSNQRKPRANKAAPIPNQHQGSNATYRKNRSNRRTLRALFPNLYHAGLLMPVKVGIKEDMLADLKARQIEMTESRLQRLLRSACTSIAYRARVVGSKYRRDINGNEAGRITKEDKQHAFAKIQEYRAAYELPPARPEWYKPVRKKGAGKGRRPPHAR